MSSIAFCYKSKQNPKVRFIDTVSLLFKDYVDVLPVSWFTIVVLNILSAKRKVSDSSVFHVAEIFVVIVAVIMTANAKDMSFLYMKSFPFFY